MSPLVGTGCIALGVVAVIVRRRSLVLTMVTLQSLLLTAVAVWRANGEITLLPAAGALLVRSLAIAAIFGFGIARTRETRPVRDGIDSMGRAVIALIALLVIPPLVPSLGLSDASAQSAAVALVVLGIVIALTRRATIVQILGVVIAENGATLVALSAPRGVPDVIELGVIVDLLLIAVVASAFHTRIFSQFGSGDSAHLQELHD